MRPGASRRLALATAALAVALFFTLPWLAASVVRGALEQQAAADRAAFAGGGSPWSWRFETPDDLVAGRVFGAGRPIGGARALHIEATSADGFEVGLPLARPTDTARLSRLTLDATASAEGRYGLAVRERLDGPLLRADVGRLAAVDLSRPIALDMLHWQDPAGHPVSAPGRAAMLRLNVILPVGERLTLARAALLPGPDTSDPAITALPDAPYREPLPTGLSAERQLAWRDALWSTDPLATFGNAPPPSVEPSWYPWLVPGLYLAWLLVATWTRSATTGPAPMDAALVLAGPLWFIASLGLSAHPHPAGIVTFVIGVAHALVLAWRKKLPAWHWFDLGRSAGWPLLAIPVAIGIAVAFGHPPVWPPAGRAAMYVAWALFQQWLLLAVVGALLDRTAPRPVAVLLTALAFALLHTPNGLLMQLCFVAELGWAWWYLKHRALLPVALAHATSAVLLQAYVAGGVLRSLEVSARFLS